MKKLFALLLVVLMGGCATTPAQPDYDTKIFFIDPGIKLQQLEARHFTRENDGHTLVNVSGIGTTDQTVYYKVDWFNEFGMPMKSIMSTWKSAKIVKNMPFNWSAVSPSPKATTFKVLITKDIGDGILN